jgi:hypothetical protein
MWLLSSRQPVPGCLVADRSRIGIVHFSPPQHPSHTLIPKLEPAVGPQPCRMLLGPPASAYRQREQPHPTPVGAAAEPGSSSLFRRQPTLWLKAFASSVDAHVITSGRVVYWVRCEGRRRHLITLSLPLSRRCCSYSVAAIDVPRHHPISRKHDPSTDRLDIPTDRPLPLPSLGESRTRPACSLTTSRQDQVTFSSLAQLPAAIHTPPRRRPIASQTPNPALGSVHSQRGLGQISG